MYKKYSGQDRRRFQRLDLNITIIYRIHEPLVLRVQFGDKEIEATMLNLSEGGIGLITSYNIPANTVLFIKLTLSRMNEREQIVCYDPMAVMGKVCSNAMLEKNEYRIGIYFTRIDQKDRDEIRNFVKMTLK